MKCLGPLWDIVDIFVSSCLYACLFSKFIYIQYMIFSFLISCLNFLTLTYFSSGLSEFNNSAVLYNSIQLLNSFLMLHLRHILEHLLCFELNFSWLKSWACLSVCGVLCINLRVALAQSSMGWSAKISPQIFFLQTMKKNYVNDLPLVFKAEVF